MKAFTWVLAIGAAFAAVAFGGRAYAARMMSSRAVTPKAMGSATPDTAKIPYARLAIDAGDRTLIAWWVPAAADSGRPAPAIMFLHGNRSAISDYVDLLRFFHREGVSAFVFDYSGFGASGGAPTLRNAIADAGIVARVFADSAGRDSRKVAFGSALGATVLLQAIDSVQRYVDGVVIEGVDASIRDAAVRSGRLPKFVAPLLVELGDNVAAASRVQVPMLAVHSYDDARTPITDAQKVVEAVPARAALVRHWRRGHSAILASSRSCDWAPVLAFVRAGALPAAKFDTTDACKLEAAARQTEDSLRHAAMLTQAVEDSIAAAARAKSAAARSAKSTTTKGKAPPAKTTPAKTAPTKTGAGTRRPPAPSMRP